jgi:hypothetical protein
MRKWIPTQIARKYPPYVIVTLPTSRLSTRRTLVKPAVTRSATGMRARSSLLRALISR